MTFVACTSNENKQTSISILKDITEPDFIAYPSSQNVLPVFRLKTDKWQSVRLRYSVLSSILYNQQYEYTLPSEMALFGNETERNYEVKKFTSKITYVLDSLSSQYSENYSCIWEPVVKELSYLQGQTSKSVLYVYSDLQENSIWYSVYEKEYSKNQEADFLRTKLLFLGKAKT
jgi:hypothetical protein